MQTFITILSPLISFITLFFAYKMHKKSMKQQQKHHEENIEISEKKYQDQLIINKENERLKYIPYLSITPKYKTNRFEGKMEKLEHHFSIPFKITNEGAGIAFSIRIKHLDDKEKPSNMVRIATAFKSNHDDGYDILGVSEPIDTNILRIEKQTEFCLYLSARNEKQEKIEPTSSIEWKFEILFSDMQERKYSQSYSFYTSTADNTICRIDSSMPRLIT